MSNRRTFVKQFARATAGAIGLAAVAEQPLPASARETDKITFLRPDRSEFSFDDLEYPTISAGYGYGPPFYETDLTDWDYVLPGEGSGPVEIEEYSIIPVITFLRRQND